MGHHLMKAEAWGVLFSVNKLETTTLNPLHFSHLRESEIGSYLETWLKVWRREQNLFWNKFWDGHIHTSRWFKMPQVENRLGGHRHRSLTEANRNLLYVETHFYSRPQRVSIEIWACSQTAWNPNVKDVSWATASTYQTLKDGRCGISITYIEIYMDRNN